MKVTPKFKEIGPLDDDQLEMLNINTPQTHKEKTLLSNHFDLAYLQLNAFSLWVTWGSWRLRKDGQHDKLYP